MKHTVMETDLSFDIRALKIKENIRTVLELMCTRQESSMIHSARPIVTPVANIAFCFLFF